MVIGDPESECSLDSAAVAEVESCQGSHIVGVLQQSAVAAAEEAQSVEQARAAPLQKIRWCLSWHVMKLTHEWCHLGRTTSVSYMEASAARTSWSGLVLLIHALLCGCSKKLANAASTALK